MKILIVYLRKTGWFCFTAKLFLFTIVSTSKLLKRKFKIKNLSRIIQIKNKNKQNGFVITLNNKFCEFEWWRKNSNKCSLFLWM